MWEPFRLWGTCIFGIIKVPGEGRLVLVPVSPPVHFEGVENRNIFSGRAISEQHLSERAVLWTAWVCGQTRAQQWGAVQRRVCFYVLCISIHQPIEPTVVCTEFVTWLVVLLFMPKGSHFAGIHTAYRERQRDLTANHYRTFSLFLAPARPFILATMSW